MSFDFERPNSQGRQIVVHNGEEFEDIAGDIIRQYGAPAQQAFQLGVKCVHDAYFDLRIGYGIPSFPNTSWIRILPANLNAKGIALGDTFYLEIYHDKAPSNTNNTTFSIYLNGSLYQTLATPWTGQYMGYRLTARGKAVYTKAGAPLDLLSSWSVQKLPVASLVEDETTLPVTLPEFDSEFVVENSGSVRALFDVSEVADSGAIRHMKLTSTARMNRRSPRNGKATLSVKFGEQVVRNANLPMQDIGAVVKTAVDGSISEVAGEPLTKENIATLPIGFDLEVINE